MDPLASKLEKLIRLTDEFAQKELFNEDVRQEKRKEIISLIRDIDGFLAYSKKVVHYTDLDQLEADSDDFDQDIYDKLVDELFMKEFDKLNAEFDMNGILIKDLRELDQKKEYVDSYMSRDSDEFEDRFDTVKNDWEVSGNIENMTILGRISTRDDIIEYLKYQGEDEDDIDLAEDDLVIKYKPKAAALMRDNAAILKEWCHGFENTYCYDNYSLTASKLYYHLPALFDFKGWRALESLLVRNI